MLLNLLGLSILLALFLLIMLIPGGAVLTFIFIVCFCFFLTILIVVYKLICAGLWIVRTGGWGIWKGGVAMRRVLRGDGGPPEAC